MKVITTGLLNRFWTKGIKPWLDKRIKSYADLMVTTASGYTTDALAVKEGFTELNGKLNNTYNTLQNISGNNFVAPSNGRVFYYLQTSNAKYSGATLKINGLVYAAFGSHNTDMLMIKHDSIYVNKGDVCTIENNVDGGYGEFQYFYPLT